MGVVYLAHDRLLDRDIALKEARDSGESASRMLQEIRILCRLEHPNIVPIHDQGVTADGRPCYTMRLIRGRTLAELLAEAKTLEDRLLRVRPLLDTTHAIAWAHRQGVIHRDLKPANILIGEFGETQVVDWGLAAITDPFAPDSRSTLSGAVLGTPAYMSPEQARGLPADPRSDIFSLGAILAELLTGAPPWGTADPAATLLRAREGVPLPFPDDLPADLKAIARKALAPDPAARYQDARALAEDLDRWLNGRPVLAHTYSAATLLRRWAQEHRLPVALVSLSILLLVGLSLAATARIAEERSRAVTAEKDLSAALAARDRNLSAALTAQARTAFQQSLWPQAEVLAAHALSLTPSPEARGVLMGVYANGRPLKLSATATPPCQEAALLPDGLICLLPDRVVRLRDGEEVWSLPGDFSGLAVNTGYAFIYQKGYLQIIDLLSGTFITSINGGNYRVYFSDKDWFSLKGNHRRIGNPATSAELMIPPCPGQSNHQIHAYLREEKYAMICDSGQVFVGDLEPPPTSALISQWGQPSRPFDPDGANTDGLALLPNSYYRPMQGRWHRLPFDTRSLSRAAAFTPDGQTLLIGHLQGELLSLNLQTGGATRSPAPIRGPIRAVWPFPDSRHIALTRSGDEIEIRRIGIDTPLLILPTRTIQDIRFPDARTIEILSEGSIQTWKLPNDLPASRLSAPLGLNPAFLSPDGRRMAATHDKGQVSVWDLPDGTHRLLQTAMGGVIKAGVFSEDSRRLLLTGTYMQPILGYSLLSYDADTLTFQSGAKTLQRYRRLIRLAGDHFIGPEYLIGAFDAEREPPALIPGCPPISFIDAATSPDGRYGVLSDMNGTIVTISADPLRCVATASHQGSAVDISSDGRTLLIGASQVIRLIRGDATIWEFSNPSLQIADVAISGDDRYAAASTEDGDIWLWDGATGGLLALMRGHAEKASGVDFFPDNRSLFSSGWDSLVLIWSLEPLDLPPDQLLRNAGLWGLSPDDLLQRVTESTAY